MDEVMVGQAVKLLTGRLASWTVWYGRHTGRFWALLNQRPGVHIEARTPAELEAQAAEVERWLLGTVIEEYAPPTPIEVGPLRPRPRPRRNPEAR
ncbi:hypothetical protein [Nonomuraea cavernae]|uniref:hypothetical protein n=1 Tax=Nonomuraea cavernae TaxID=2045107 RepID=UPI003402FCAD